MPGVSAIIGTAFLTVPRYSAEAALAKDMPWLADSPDEMERARRRLGLTHAQAGAALGMPEVEYAAVAAGRRVFAFPGSFEAAAERFEGAV